MAQYSDFDFELYGINFRLTKAKFAGMVTIIDRYAGKHFTIDVRDDPSGVIAQITQWLARNESVVLQLRSSTARKIWEIVKSQEGTLY